MDFLASMSAEQFAVAYTAASLGLTALHKIVEVARYVASKTASKADDHAVTKAEGVLAFLDQALGFFAVRLGRK